VTKSCRKGGNEKECSEFRSNPRCSDGLSSWCGECHNEASRLWRKRRRAAEEAEARAPPAGRRREAATHLGGVSGPRRKASGRAAAAVRLSAAARAARVGLGAFVAAGTATGDSASLSSRSDRIALAMWLKRLFGRGENVSPSGHASSRKETEQDREDRLEDFMDEQVRQRDEDESRMQDEGGN
jgi:hypothetical protein